MILVSSWSCLWHIHWRQVLSREWRCSWGSADTRYSNFIWVINFVAFSCASYIIGLTILLLVIDPFTCQCIYLLVYLISGLHSVYPSSRTFILLISTAPKRTRIFALCSPIIWDKHCLRQWISITLYGDSKLMKLTHQFNQEITCLSW